MSEPSRSRRDFLQSASMMLGGGWLALHATEVEALGLAAHRAVLRQEPFQNLSPVQARTLAAFAEQIVPSDSLPGAREAGAIYFIDKSLGGFASGFKDPVLGAAAALDEAARKANSKVTSFADLSIKQQVSVMKKMEREGWFFPVRMLAVLGVFADPSYGGNRNHVGFTILDMQHAPAYQPPFGYYDAEVAK